METIIDFSDQIGEVRDQGSRETCLAFATTAAHELLHGLNQELCVEWLYFYTVKYAGDKLGEGTFIPDISSALGLYGQPLEEVWRYKDTANFEDWIPPKYPEPLYHANGIYGNFVLDHIVDFLNDTIPVVITLTTDLVFQYPTVVNGEAIVEHDPESVKDMVHAVLVVGYGEIKNRKYFKVLNSWGKNWGSNRFAWLSEKFLEVNADEMLRLQLER